LQRLWTYKIFRGIYKRTTPDDWAKFATAANVTKIIRHEQPKQLFNLLQKKIFLFNNEKGVLVNSLMDQKWQRGTAILANQTGVSEGYR